MIKKTRVLIVCHDRYMSGANQALQDWLNDGAYNSFGGTAHGDRARGVLGRSVSPGSCHEDAV